MDGAELFRVLYLFMTLARDQDAMIARVALASSGREWLTDVLINGVTAQRDLALLGAVSRRVG